MPSESWPSEDRSSGSRSSEHWPSGNPGQEDDTGERRFTVSESAGPADTVLRLAGELDHDAAPAFRAALRGSEDAGAPRVLVDCSALVFCDSTGLNLLLEARNRAQARGAEIVLVAMAPRVARLFEMTGAQSLFPRYDSLAQARAET